MTIPRIRVNIDYGQSDEDIDKYNLVKDLLEKCHVDAIRGKMHSDILTVDNKDLQTLINELIFKYREACPEDKEKIKSIKPGDDFQIMIETKNNFKLVHFRAGFVLNKTKISIQEYDFMISTRYESNYHRSVVQALKNIFENDLPKIIAFFMTHCYNFIE